MEYNLRITTKQGICNHCSCIDRIVYEVDNIKICAGCILLPEYNDYAQDMFNKNVLDLNDPRLTN